MLPGIRVKDFWQLAAVATAFLATSAFAETTTIRGTDGGNDSWNTASNWDLGVPTGSMDAVVGDGIQAKVDNAATATYSGSLTLGPNATLSMNGAVGSEKAVTGASDITMHAGSKIVINVNKNFALPSIVLTGDGTIETIFGASDWQTTEIGAVSGPYTLTISGFNGHTYNLNSSNTFSEFVSKAIDRYNIRAKAPGSLGTGDVTVNPRDRDGRSAQLFLDAADTIADHATLTLNGNGFDAATDDRITIAAGVNETVAALFVDGVALAPGTYDDSAPWLSGEGTLTVLPGSEPLFVRGDADANGTTDLTDGVFVLNFLFTGGPEPSCHSAADADGSDEISITDGIYVLSFLFLGEPAPPAPWPDCGPNPENDGDVACEVAHPHCRVQSPDA